jgi:hypothetical protein
MRSDYESLWVNSDRIGKKTDYQMLQTSGEKREKNDARPVHQVNSQKPSPMKNPKSRTKNKKDRIGNPKPHKLTKGKELMTEEKMNREMIINGNILKNHKETR